MKKDHMQLLMEQMRDELKAVHELVADVPKMSRKLDAVDQRLEKVEQSVEVIRAAVTATNRDVAGLDQRVTRLEAA